MPSHKDSSARPHDHRLPPVSAKERHALWVALALTASFAVVECVGGWLAGSLALLSDAGHMVTDVAALSIALIAQRLARRPPSQRASYGYARAEVLAAFSNALLMLGVVVWIAVEAVRRLLAPTPVAGLAVISVASAGLAVNLICAWMLSHGRSLNARAALVHVLGDLAGSIAALVAGAVVAATGWMPSDFRRSRLVAAMSSMERHGNVSRYGRPVRGSAEAGPVEPRHDPNELLQITNQRLVSSGRPGPIISSHQPGWGLRAFERAWLPGERPVVRRRALSFAGASVPHVSYASVTSGISPPR